VTSNNANEEDASQFRGMSLEQAHKMTRDIDILELQDQVSRLIRLIAQAKEATEESPYFKDSLNLGFKHFRSILSPRETPMKRASS